MSIEGDVIENLFPDSVESIGACGSTSNVVNAGIDEVIIFVDNFATVLIGLTFSPIEEFKTGVREGFETYNAFVNNFVYSVGNRGRSS